MAKTITRRTVLLRGIQVPLGGGLLLGLGACGGKGETSLQCIDANQLSESERGMRASLNYTPTSPNPQEVCAGCAYFGNTGASSGGCGHCDLLQGQVAGEGRCDSWSAKA